MPFNKLTPQEEEIILGKETEAPFSGEYDNYKNTRHCVNSLSIKFIPQSEKLPAILQE